MRHAFHKAGPPAEGGKGQDNDKKEGDKAEEFPEVGLGKKLGLGEPDRARRGSVRLEPARELPASRAEPV
jgi:hypothetical protein